MFSIFGKRRVQALFATAAMLLAIIISLQYTDRGARTSLQFRQQIAGCLPATGGDTLLSQVAFRISVSDNTALPPNLKPVLAEPPFYELSMRDYILFLVQHLVSDEKHAISVRINQPPKEGALNIYFVDCTLNLPSGPFNKGSCIYFGHFNSIICRTAYFQEIFNRYDSTDRVFDLVTFHTGQNYTLGASSPTLLKYTASLLKRDLVSWIIGHEIGHAILHRDLFHTSGMPLHFDFQYNQQEEEADRFFAQRIGRNHVLAALGMSITLSEVIHREYRAIAQRSIPALTPDDLNTSLLPSVLPIEVNLAAYDFPLIVRAMRVQDAIFREGIEYDRSGYPEAVRANVFITEPTVARILSRQAALALIAVAAVLAGLILIGGKKWFN